MMRAHFLLVLTVTLCIQFHYTLSQTPRFYQCGDDGDCPRGARCVDENDNYFNDRNAMGNYGRCRCDTGLYPYTGDIRLTVDPGIFDQQTISCRGINSCNQYSNDCGPYGYCEEIQGRYYCRCTDGYSGERCDIPGDGVTRRRQMTNIIPLIGAGVAALVLLGVGGAALSSLSG